MAFDPTEHEHWSEVLAELTLERGAERAQDVRGKQARWLATFVRTGSRTQAAADAGVSYRVGSRWQTADQLFREALELAKQAHSERLVGEATRRAVDGVRVAIRDRHGAVVDYETELSDRLLMFLLKGVDTESRWRPAADVRSAPDESWRDQLLKAAQDPALLAQLDAIANKLTPGQNAN